MICLGKLIQPDISFDWFYLEIFRELYSDRKHWININSPVTYSAFVGCIHVSDTKYMYKTFPDTCTVSLLSLKNAVKLKSDQADEALPGAKYNHSGIRA